MNWVIAFASTVALTLGTPAFSDTVDWLDRCLDQADKDEAKAEKELYDLSLEYCVAATVKHCVFVADSSRCFSELQSTFANRSDELISTFNEQLQAANVSDFNWRRYQQLVKSVSQLKPELLCQASRSAIECDTFQAGVRFSSLRQFSDTIEGWVKGGEDKQ